eukprot:1004156-Pyramimonas_sp.AAC.2
MVWKGLEGTWRGPGGGLEGSWKGPGGVLEGSWKGPGGGAPGDPAPPRAASHASTSAAAPRPPCAEQRREGKRGAA